MQGSINTMPVYWTVKEVARHYRVSAKTIYNWVSKGEWKHGQHYIKAGTGRNAPLRLNAVEVASWFAADRKLEVKL